jgi:uncharacterized membrane protein (DUF106 family)
MIWDKIIRSVFFLQYKYLFAIQGKGGLFNLFFLNSKTTKIPLGIHVLRDCMQGCFHPFHMVLLLISIGLGIYIYINYYLY